MKQTINFSQFCDAFNDTYKNNFSYEGKKALFEYLKNLEEETGEEIELDTVALCCEYIEYNSLTDCLAEYDSIKTLEELQDRTQYIPIYNIDSTESQSFIIQQF